MFCSKSEDCPSVALMTGAHSSPALKWIPSFCWFPIAHRRTFCFLSSPFTTLYSVRVVTGGGTQDLYSGYGADEFKCPMLLEALVLLVVCLCPFLAVSTPHGVLEVLGRTVGIDFALARCRCSVIPPRELYFHQGNQSPSID